MIVVSEDNFKSVFFSHLMRFKGKVESVTGPGGSGAIAAVYASYFLHVPYFPFRKNPSVCLKPVLVVDTASMTGKTIRKALRKMGGGAYGLYVFKEPPIVRFWYEDLSCESKYGEFDGKNMGLKPPPNNLTPLFFFYWISG